jgi:hypothetical protein
MIDNAIVLDIGIESGNHSLSEPSAVAPVIFCNRVSFQLQTGRLLKPTRKRVFLNGNTSIFSRSISIFPSLIRGRDVA